MRLPASFKWIGLALLGLLIATAVALAATSLISRQIGIDSESITAGDTLAPAFNNAGKGQGSEGEAEPEGQTKPTNPGEGGSGESVEPESEPGGEVEPGGESESESGDGGEGPDD